MPQESFWKSKKGDFFKNKKKGLLGKLFKRKATPVKQVKRKVREIIIESPLEKKFEAHKGLLLKIPKAKMPTHLGEQKSLQKSKEQLEKERRLKEKRKGKKLTLLIIPNEEYLKNIIVISKQASIKYPKILYISLNELYDNLIRTFEENSINPDHFYFIDAITRTAQTNIDQRDNCYFVTSPNALIELSLVITEKINKMEPDLIIFDSLSTLFIYEKESIAVKFVHSLLGKIKAAGCDAVLTSLEGDAKRQAIKDLGMFVDEFLTMSEYQLRNLKMTGEEVPLIPKATPKEQELKKEMDKIFPQRKEQHGILPNEKQIILREMKGLKESLANINVNPRVDESLERIEKRMDTLEKKPISVDTSIIQRELISLGKKIEGIRGEKSQTIDIDATMNKVLEKFNSRMLEIEEKLQQEQKVLFYQSKKLQKRKYKSKSAKNRIKQRAKIKKVIQTKKQDEKQVKNLEKKLALLNKSFALGLISRTAYEKDKRKIEKLIKK